MHPNAIPAEAFNALVALFEEFLRTRGHSVAAKADQYYCHPGASITYGAANEDDWWFDDPSITTPQEPALVDNLHEDFLAWVRKEAPPSANTGALKRALDLRFVRTEIHRLDGKVHMIFLRSHQSFTEPPPAAE